ncbi:hypothetical protein Nepgr_025510 [Nepenthes gracilis]|uniref:Uncharacterized protein n=1 Tax=Nepenthes gracilis TaxID=150966 RepID=A0AAD3XZK8_NEPGR|nr:hypothetical protein Nepgr_025510 [Nepenthes gracilis]
MPSKPSAAISAHPPPPRGFRTPRNIPISFVQRSFGKRRRSDQLATISFNVAAAPGSYVALIVRCSPALHAPLRPAAACRYFAVGSGCLDCTGSCVNAVPVYLPRSLISKSLKKIEVRSN